VLELGSGKLMEEQIYLRLYEELNDYLPPEKRKRRFACQLDGITTVEELLENLAIPEGEVELILVNGVSVDFSCLLKAGDFISIYPVFESFNVKALLRARKEPLRRTRFMAGPGLLRLTRYLRQLGFDAVDFRSRKLENMVRVAEEERRILLTRDPSLLKSPELSRIYLVRAARPRDQLLDVLSRFDLLDSVHPGPHLMPARRLK